MNIMQLIGDGADGVLPEEIAPLIKALVEGRVKQFICIAELDDGNILDGFPILDDSADRYRMVGALEVIKRDYLRQQIDSRVRYVVEGDE